MIQNHQQYQAVLIRELYLYCLQLAFLKELSLFFSLVEKLLEETNSLEESEESLETDIAEFLLKKKSLLAETEDSAETCIGSLLGQEYDPESSLYYYNARYYDPAIGVFTTADTIIDGPYTSTAYNRYMYVHGNPVRYTDPTGHCAIVCIGAIIGGLVGGVMGGTKGNPFKADNWENFDFGGALKGAVIGAIAGGTGAWVGGKVAASLGGGFWGSVGGGAAGGGTGGFIGASGNAWANGASFGEGLGAGLKGGLIGGAIAAVTAGALYGIGELSFCLLC